MQSGFLGGGIGPRAIGGSRRVWYESAGVAPVAVYQPLGSASLAASYRNLANPGTYDAVAPVAAPTFDAATGWTFNGATQYLNTGIIPEGDQTWSMLIRFSDSVPSATDCLAGVSSGANRSFSLSVISGGTYFFNGSYLSFAVGITAGVLCVAGAKAYTNGVQEAGSIGAYADTINHSVWIGAVNVSGSFVDGFAGKIQAIAIFDVALTAEQVARMTAAIQTLEYVAAPSIATSLLPANLFENGYDTAQSGYYESSSGAFARFVTSSRVLGIDIHSNLFATIPTACHVDVRVDGVSHLSPRAQAAGAQRLYVPLPAGTKTVDIVAGGVSKPVSTMLGTFLVGVLSDNSLALATPSSTNRLLIYGDSIATGQAGTVYARDGWPTLLRAERDNVMVEAWGYRGLYTDCNTAELRGAFVARVAGYAPAEIWLAIGTNDYGLALWPAPAFGTAYAALLDDLHTALPDAVIYCQTPISRTTETANGLGSTMADYRTQIDTAVSTRTAYATLVDGTAWTVALADGVHPTTAGHAAHYAGVATVLGL